MIFEPPFGVATSPSIIMTKSDDLRWGRVKRRGPNLNATPVVEDFPNAELQESGLARSNSFAAMGGRSNDRNDSNRPILVEDEDDEVQVCSPRSFHQAKQAVQVERENESLQLRLGPAADTRKRKRKHILFQESKTCPGRTMPLLDNTIDLTTNSEETQPKKAATVEPVPTKQLTFTCSICYDTIKDETSTVCGHVFCWTCIHTAITTQKKCPTCRRKLSMSNIHRLYLGGNMS